MNNPILEKIIDSRKGHYCHVVEVSDTYELECIAEQIISDFQDDHTENEIIEFLTSLEVYSLDDGNEENIYAFDFDDYVRGTL